MIHNYKSKDLWQAAPLIVVFSFMLLSFYSWQSVKKSYEAQSKQIF